MLLKGLVFIKPRSDGENIAGFSVSSSYLTSDEIRLGSRLKTSEIIHHLLFVKHCFLFAQGM